MIVAFVALACAAWFAAGVFTGLSWCSCKHHCIRQQRRDVRQWEKEITGEITQDMQERLRRREAMDAALKDTGDHPAQPDPRAHQAPVGRPRADKDNEGNR